MTIRPYRDSDLETLKAITVEAFDGVSIDQSIERRFGLVAGHDWRWRKARHIDDDVAEPGAEILVAEDDQGMIVGYVTTRIDREAGVGHIPNMSVRAAQRGQGIGRALIQRALELFHDAGLELARIETLEQNDVGGHLYPACGFVEVARQIHFAKRLDQGEGRKAEGQTAEAATMRVEVRLFATLRRYLPADGDGTKATLELAEGTRLHDVIDRLGIPPQLAQLVMVDGVHETDQERELRDGMVLSVFPPVAGGRGNR